MTSIARKYLRIPAKISEEKLFRRMISVSIGLHVFILLFFGIKAGLFPNEPIDLEPTIRVDMVGLPDKVAQLPEEKPKAAPKKAEPKVEPKTEPKIEAHPKAPEKPAPVPLHPKHDTKKAVERIKEMAKEEERKKALEKIQQEVAAEEAKKERAEKVEKILKGNQVNSGSSLHGLQKSEFNEYIADLRNHIHNHWNLPEWLSNDTLKATVVVFLDYRGVVVKRQIQKSSGDSRFDDYALKAVDDASPFPKPPAQFVDLVRGEGIVLGFPQ